MAKKSYKPQDNELPQVNEPVAAYHVTTPNANLYVPTEYEQEIIMHSEKDYEQCIEQFQLHKLTSFN